MPFTGAVSYTHLAAPSSVVITYEQDISDIISGGNNYTNVENAATLLYPNGNEANKGSTWIYPKKKFAN